MSTKLTPKPVRPRLGRGLSSLISMSDLPVELEVLPSGSTDIPVCAPVGSPEPVASPGAPGVPSARREPIQNHQSKIQNSQSPSPVAGPQSPLPSPADIPLDRIRPNPSQPRRTWNEPSLADLAASIKSTGIIQPIVVRQLADGYELVAGERRLRAAKLAGLSVIPAIVRHIDSLTQAQMALVENIQREDLNAIERAQAYRTLIEQLGLTQNELATRLGQERSAIANYLRLLDLSEPVRAMVRDGKLSVGHAKIIAGVTDILQQQRLAELVVREDLSVRNLERIIANPATPLPTRTKSVPSAHIVDLERTITRQLGMKVQVKSARKGRGRVVIHYASLDQFDDLLSRLGVKTE